MPTIEAASRPDNIIKSLNAYIITEIVGSLEIPVYFMGQERFDEPPKWVESDFIYPLQVTMLDRGPNGSIGAQAECYLNLNVFLRDHDGLQPIGIYEMPTLITNIVERFDIPTEIPVRDYLAVGTPIIGSLRVHEKPRAQMIGTAPDSGVMQANVSVLLRYHSFTIYS